MAEPLVPGSVIGILGGGQLGRMLSIAAARLGLRCHIYEPGDAPAAQVAGSWTRAGWDDRAALEEFARSVDAVTLEFENVPVSVLDVLEPIVPVRPGRLALATAQDRLAEKEFLNGIGLVTAGFHAVDSEDDLAVAMDRLGAPGILKTRRMGYDGKGQARISSPLDRTAAWTVMKGQAAIYEAFVPFEREISVIAARGVGGETVAFDPGENVHRDGILDTTTVPAAIPARLRQDAVLAAGRLLNALDYVGVIGVEMFVAPGSMGGGLVVNEFAPRVHNSGHWTIEACVVDQFQQQIRAVAGWPLGDGARHSDAVMTNLIGTDAAGWQALLAEPGAGLHLYGKSEIRPGRKMGHVTRLLPKG